MFKENLGENSNFDHPNVLCRNLKLPVGILSEILLPQLSQNCNYLAAYFVTHRPT